MKFDMPKDTPSIIKVVGVGGGGSNAVNHMFTQGIKGVDFLICNTDHQALESSPVPHKIQLGLSLTEGMGAGSIPEVGRNAAIETVEEIREILNKNTKMVFITAGMGGGTGTGAAPIIAQVAREMGILTVGIVTMPFFFEGRKRRQQAEEGIQQIRESVDTLLVINNDKLREMYGNLKMREAFAQADNVLTTAARGIAEIITRTGHVNVDFEDVKTVMIGSGVAIMGSATAEGENRAIKAVENALASPLLNDNDIKGARYVLLNMEYGNEEITMDEIADITDYIQEEAGLTADVIWGYGENESLESSLSVTIIATGFNVAPNAGPETLKPREQKKVVSLDENVNTTLTKPVANTPKVETKDEQEPFIKKAEQHTIKFDLGKDKVEPTVNESTTQDEPEDAFEPYLKPAAPVAPESNIPKTPVTPPPPTQSFSAPEPVEQQPEAPKFPTNSADFTFKTVTSSPEPVKNEMPEKPAETPAQPSGFSMEEQQRRAKERMSRLSDLSSRWRTPGGLSDMEDVPAYKRRQINLDDTPHSSESQVSRFTLSEEEGPDGQKRTEIRPNNSFLHDQVD